MHNYESEFNTMVVVEQRLLNARSELNAAVRRLGGGYGELAEGIRAVAEELDDSIALTWRTRRIMLREWQKTGAERQAA